jgi:hypothetical protein
LLPLAAACCRLLPLAAACCRLLPLAAACCRLLPLKSPWLNPIEPKWIHGKRRITEPSRLLSAREVEERVCQALHCPLTDHLALPQDVA